MRQDIYKDLCKTMADLGGRYPGKDIPEFYDLVEELYTPAEAAAAAAMTSRQMTAQAVAENLGWSAADARAVLEGLSDKLLCLSVDKDGTRYYVSVPFVPGIFEFQFSRGTWTEKDRRIARLIHAYKNAFDRDNPPPAEAAFSMNRVIPINETIRSESKIHPFSQMNSYIDQADTIGVYTCFCRHEAKLLDEKDDCGMPMEVCMLFGSGARFFIDRGVARQLTKEEAKKVLRTAAEAGLVHAGLNSQKLDFICNCCRCHCMIMKDALGRPKPGRYLQSGYHPRMDPDLCIGCETCIGRCPAAALTISGGIPVMDPDRCIGCGVCAVGCFAGAIAMAPQEEIPIPPATTKDLMKMAASKT
ncbi:MAG: hypothetical protein EG826_06945 [Deltaproteobacteria bacterium]|nr:hypothetical protein [Deltaproteobacteria bacterium]